MSLLAVAGIPGKGFCGLDLAEWANISTVATAVLALVALLGVFYQVAEGRKAQREATASQLYASYLTLAVEYPRLAGAEVKKHELEEYERYEWFVSVMLHACEQILELTQGDTAWRKTILSQFIYHKDYLAEEFDPEEYSNEVGKLVGKALEPASA